jgi:hypothetical protein
VATRWLHLLHLPVAPAPPYATGDDVAARDGRGAAAYRDGVPTQQAHPAAAAVEGLTSTFLLGLVVVVVTVVLLPMLW